MDTHRRGSCGLELRRRDVGDTMTVNLHEHFTGGQIVVVVICELLWWTFVVLVGRKWWRRRHAKKREIADTPYPTK